jgi:N-acetylglucosamine kinase-like BadF-type ATPase
VVAAAQDVPCHLLSTFSLREKSRNAPTPAPAHSFPALALALTDVTAEEVTDAAVVAAVVAVVARVEVEVDGLVAVTSALLAPIGLIVF